jgi:hypothetical protein
MVIPPDRATYLVKLAIGMVIEDMDISLSDS